MKLYCNNHIKIMNEQEFKDSYKDIYNHFFEKEQLTLSRYTHVSQYNKVVIGTFFIPILDNYLSTRNIFQICIINDELIFINEGSFIVEIFEQLLNEFSFKKESIFLILYYFLKELVRNDMKYLRQYEEKLELKEEALLQGEIEHFEQEVFKMRKQLTFLSNYYSQLSDVADFFEEYSTKVHDNDLYQLFGLYVEQVNRLEATVQSLKEYSRQLYEMNETQVNLRQNEIMKFLTIITTIFMPLTLITGWYGMNFIDMPELQSDYGYLIVCLVCIIFVSLEFLWLKSKKWFK